MMPNLPIERTCPGKPGHTDHVQLSKEQSVLPVGLVVVLFLSFGIVFADSGPVSPPGLFRHLQHICAGINNSYDCAREVEADRLKKGIIGVSRNGHDLVINPSASPAVAFADIEGEGSSQGQRYSYVDYFPSIRSHVVYVQYYEGGDFILINSVSGQKTNVWSMPIASPDSSRFLTAFAAIAYGPNGL
ncbi:MAG: hypothetical protein ABIE47_00340 [Pseudomonadota bacterium]